MKALTVLLGFCLIAAAFGVPSPRIVGGHDAPPGKYPYVVSLQVGGEHRCAGVIFNRRYVATSAECIFGLKPEEVTISAGTYDLSKPYKIYGAETLITHPEFNAETKVHNVGLIRLNQDIVFEYGKIYTGDAAGTGEIYRAGDNVTFVGFGMVDANGTPAARLQEYHASLLPISNCQTSYPQFTSRIFCTLTEPRGGLCTGDYGGPLIDKKGLLMGIISFGSPCGRDLPDVFSRYTSYREWFWNQFV